MLAEIPVPYDGKTSRGLGLNLRKRSITDQLNLFVQFSFKYLQITEWPAPKLLRPFDNC